MDTCRHGLAGERKKTVLSMDMAAPNYYIVTRECHHE
jgi:hypothetical protein